MYAIKNIFDKTPLMLSGAIMGVVNFLILMEWLSMDGKQVSGLNLALVGVLGLFVATKTANKAVLEELAESQQGGGK